MTSERTVARRRPRRVAAIASALAIAVATSAFAGHARAQTEDELQAARELFQEAYQDEQDKRYDQALEKFLRVARVKESPSVRYRIGSVQEALGRLRESRDTFRALAAQKDGMPAKDQPIAESAAERAAALDKRIPHLVVRVPEGAPPDAKMTIDGAPVPTSTVARPIELDPGDHVVQASAEGAKPFEAKVTLAEGAETQIDVAFAPLAPPPPPPPPPPHRNRTLAYVALAAGGVLLVGGAAFLLVRESDIDDIHHKCPGDVCPIASKDELESEHSQAALFGPLGVGSMVLGAVAAGAGVYLLFKPAPAPSATPAVGSASPTPAAISRLHVGSRLVHGGAVLGVGGAF
jgi:hypothetical protein